MAKISPAAMVFVKVSDKQKQNESIMFNAGHNHVSQANTLKNGNSAFSGCMRSATKHTVPASPSYKLYGVSGVRAPF